MVTHIPWSSIELFHNIVRYFDYLKEIGTLPPVVSYRGKVKLHGTNCAVQVHADGVFCQSRNMMLTPEADYKGFAKWVADPDNHYYFRKLGAGVTIYGEWAGPGIEDGVALANLSEKVFAVFALQEGYGESARVVYDPSEIAAYLEASVGQVPKNMHVLPWYGSEFTIDFRDRASMEAAVVLLNGVVAEVEREDPWVKAVFSVSGVGEGIVLYPIAVNGGPVSVEPQALAHFMFKAKGAEHKNTAAKQAVQVDTEVLASVGAFVEFMVTPARLAQGVQAACGGQREKRDTAKFITWTTADVRKESVAELEASGLTWVQVEKAVQAKAREWFLAR